MNKVTASPPKIDGIDKWEVEDAASTLQRAFEIKANKKLCEAAVKLLRKRKMAAGKALTWAEEMKEY